MTSLFNLVYPTAIYLPMYVLYACAWWELPSSRSTHPMESHFGQDLNAYKDYLLVVSCEWTEVFDYRSK